MKRLIFSCLLLTSTAAFCADQAFVTVRPHAVDQSFPMDGVVEAVQQTTVGARIAGRILEVRADAGQTVKKGDLLMRLDAREAEDAARAAEAQYVNAKAAYERNRSLLERKFVSQSAVDKARADFDAAAANRSAAGAGQSHAQILAPIDGIIARRHAEAGDMAMPGTPLFTIYQPGKLRVTASIPQARLPQARSVTAARVEFPETAQWLDGASIQIIPAADAATHVSQVRVVLPATASALPGSFARVHFVTGQAEKLTVPAEAVVRRGEVAAVYVQTDDGRASLRQIRLGDAVGHGEIEVLAGLAAGSKVLTNPVKAAIQLREQK
jgi:RND family efflux transporter MFP subunit